MKVLTEIEIENLGDVPYGKPAALIQYLSCLTATILEGTSTAMLPDDIRMRVITGAVVTLQAVNAINEHGHEGTNKDIIDGLTSALAVALDLANQANNRLIVLVETLAKIGIPISLQELDLDLTSRLKQAKAEMEKAA